LGDRILLVVTVVVVAPVGEEFLFRSLLLFWAARRSWRSEIVLVVTLGLALVSGLIPRSEQVGAGRSWYEQNQEPQQDFDGILHAPAEKEQGAEQEADYWLLTKSGGQQVARLSAPLAGMAVRGGSGDIPTSVSASGCAATSALLGKSDAEPLFTGS